MKVTSMKSAMKKLAFPLLVGGVLLSGSARADDIVSIKSDQANQTFTSSGQQIEFRVSLAGYFVLTNAFMASTSFMPELRMIVNGDLAYATLDSVSQYKLGGLFDRTDCYFRYRVKPGDMAQPLRIYGGPVTPYQINWKGWAMRSATNLTTDAVWVFDPTKSQVGLGEKYDIDLSQAKITIRTLSFEDAYSPSSVAATESITWRATSVNPTESAVVGFYVWTPGTNIIQLGSVPNQTWLLVQMPTNTIYKDFAIKGLAVGTTEIYLQRPVDYANNFTAIGVTNYIKKTISVTTPPEPTVRVVMTDTATDSITLGETTLPNTGSFEIQLSEAFSNNVVVRVDATPVGQSNVTFATTPFYVSVPNGDTRSSVAKFNVPDGTVASAGAGVVLTPVVVSNAAAIAYFTRQREGHVYVQNVKPLITQPLATDTPTAIQHSPFTFSWNVSDVVPDMASGMSLTWIFGDGTTNYTTHGSAGTVQHTYVTTGAKVVKVRAKDKDGTQSDEVQFVVTVEPPVPQPNVRLAPNVGVFGETAALNTGSLDIYLSEPYSTAVDVLLVTDPLVQSNFVFASTNVVTIPPGSTNAPIPQKFSLRDGTQASGSTGVRVHPVVVNAASAYFTDLRDAYLFLTNINPNVTYPVSGDILAPAVPPYDSIYMTVPFTFDYTVSDVPADLSTMLVRWNFGDGTTLTVTGAVGSVSHTYNSLGNKYVWVEAEDKDGGLSARIQFKVTVVSPPPAPTVRVLPPAGPVSETTAPNTGALTVQLSEAYTGPVTVGLAVTPANSLVNGTIVLATTSVVFNVGELEKTVRFSARDGTDQSYMYGFVVTPRVVASPAAAAYFTNSTPGTVEIMNVNPVINNPLSSDLTADPVRYVAQGSATDFIWDVSDVPNDQLNSPLVSAMTCTWNFGDGSGTTVYGGSGVTYHTYTAVGEMTVHFVARDKDGGFAEVRYKIQVLPAKAVNVTPIGPNAADYYGMRASTGSSPDGGGGIGFGIVLSPEAQGWQNRGNTYYFRYTPSSVSATLEAYPYKTSVAPFDYYQVTNYSATGSIYLDPTHYLHDSFFFVWVGEEQGIAAAKLLPQTTTASTTVSLPTASDTGDATEIRDVSAVFSREYYIEDNVGDINADGIPDDTANWILSQISDAGGGDTGADSTPVWLTALNVFNDDFDKPNGTAVGDFLPINTTGANGTFDFRPIASPNTTPNGLSVNAFTAILEVRGYHKGLNRLNVSDDDFNDAAGETQGDEPKTNPTLVDTDGDSFPDGWEYWFWYQATMRGMTGSRYDPANPAVGTVIASSAIAVYFDPIAYNANADLDNDGLSTEEELAVGTNPVNFDTDGDGICDGYEIFMALSPVSTSAPDFSRNPDGDYMAIASVTRRYVTLRTGSVTNHYLIDANAALTQGAQVPAALLNNQFKTAYVYGDANVSPTYGRLAEGRLVAAVPANTFVVDFVNTNALLMHFQVANEFGFDPRTAWAGTMNMHPDFARFPTWIENAANTRAFTSYDEYLLVQFMAATGANGAPTLMPSGAATWAAFSTNPMTPNTDYDPVTQITDGMPDGWELYVSIEPGAANRTAMTISPWVTGDGIGNHPRQPERDGLNHMREFAGTDSIFAYSNENLYNSSNALQVVSILRQTSDEPWINKFWPTNPWKPDTDGDGLADDAERTFVYGTPTDNQSTLIQGGGLNPNAMDTDLDALPDKWESEFTGTPPAGAGPFSGSVITNGMDGTFQDADGGTHIFHANGLSEWSYDWDHDGLLNYQEYWVQAVRSLRYDLPPAGVGLVTGNPGLPMSDACRPWELFTLVTNDWDLSKFPWGDRDLQLRVLLPLGASNLYVSTDPRNPDTDVDSMDDYYELFHGLNPILGYGTRADALDDRVARAYIDNGQFTIDYGTDMIGNDWGAGLLMDFVTYPWLAGRPDADPDADGLLNLEEQLLANSAAPQNYNTDPTPLWMTDGANPNSETRSFYRPGKIEDLYYIFAAKTHSTYFWPRILPPMYIYGYEMNEGYDTDNDGVSDKSELVDSRNPLSSPQDHDDPVRRQALYFTGTNSAASTVSPFNQYLGINPQILGDFENAFRSFTVELWARPQRTNEQVILERGFLYGPSDLSTTNTYVRRNYQVGITHDGHVYACFDNAGADTHDFHTARAVAVGHSVVADTWMHIAVRMSGRDQMLTLFVNGEIQDEVATALTPANGIMTVRGYPTGPGLDHVTYSPGTMVMGAANDVPGALWPNYTMAGDWVWDQEWAGFTKFYQGWIDEVRIWDGARDNESIRADVKKRYTHNDLWENRAQIAERIQRGYTRVAEAAQQLPPQLMFHYTFDNLFGGESEGAVALEPRGFAYLNPHTYVSNIVTTVETNYVANPDLTVTTNVVTTVTTNTVTETFPNVVEINRPLAPGAEVPWWRTAEVASTVYTNFNYLPWIENGVDHMPLFGYATTNSEGVSVLYMTNGVLDSIYWTHTMAGNVGQVNSFMNRCNPYGFFYIPWHFVSQDSLDYGTDLLPLGGAYAKQVEQMWDCQGAASAWLDTSTDSDADGMPDWWETLVMSRFPSLNLNFASIDWDDYYPNSSMTYGEVYQRDVAVGWSSGDTTASGPTGYRQTADSDLDGMFDWWERLYNLDYSYPNGSAGKNGAGGDPDIDGLSNLAEFQISEVYTDFNVHLSPLLLKSFSSTNVTDYYLKVGNLTFGSMFADHDFMEDSWEDEYDPYYVNRFVYDPTLDYDEDGWSNWSECRFERNGRKSNPSQVMHLYPSVQGSQNNIISEMDFPVPIVETRFSYDGIQSVADIVVHAYSDSEMDGPPDAIFTIPAPSTTANAKNKSLGFWGSREVSGYLSPGSIVPGTINMRFTDVSPDGRGWTVQAAYDRFDEGAGTTGVIVGQDGSGWETVIGTIDYVTGYFEMDLTWYNGVLIVQQVSATQVYVVDPVSSFITVNYGVSMIDGWPKTVHLTDADTGYLREGANYFFAFMDLNGNDAWDAGEPCGVATPFVTDIGWHNNKVSIHLTDYTKGYLRMTIAPAARSEDIYWGTQSGGQQGGAAGTTTLGLENRVRVRRSVVDGWISYQKVVLDKVLDLRTYLHEGDFLAQGDFALDWGIKNDVGDLDCTLVGYEVFVGNAAVLTNNAMVLTFTNRFDVEQAKAVAKMPMNGAYVYASRPTFRWTMPEEYTAFAIEVRKGSPTGPQVYWSSEQQAPVRDVVTGECVWQAPIHAGNKLLKSGQIFSSNTVYAWRVTALNAKFTLDETTTTGGGCEPCGEPSETSYSSDTTWSDWKMFRLDVNSPMQSSGYGQISAVVKYYGTAKQLTDRVKVQVYDNQGFNGVPVAQYTLPEESLDDITAQVTTNVNAVLRGLAPSSKVGSYYVRAYIDSNLNDVRDEWESWGYANYYAQTDQPYSVRPFDVEFENQSCGKKAMIYIEDADVDQDWFPDVWEYEKNPSGDFLALTGPVGIETRGDTEVNPSLATGGSFWATSMFAMLALGTTDQDGDGLEDMIELMLGTDAVRVSTLSDGYKDSDKVDLGLAPQDVLQLAVTDIGLSGAGAAVQWKLDVTRDASVDRSMLKALLGVSGVSTVNYYIDYTPSLLQPAWTTVRIGTVTLDGSQTLEGQIDTSVIDLSQGFFRVRLAK